MEILKPAAFICPHCGKKLPSLPKNDYCAINLKFYGDPTHVCRKCKQPYRNIYVAEPAAELTLAQKVPFHLTAGRYFIAMVIAAVFCLSFAISFEAPELLLGLPVLLALHLALSALTRPQRQKHKDQLLIQSRHRLRTLVGFRRFMAGSLSEENQLKLTQEVVQPVLIQSLKYMDADRPLNLDQLMQEVRQLAPKPKLVPKCNPEDFQFYCRSDGTLELTGYTGRDARILIPQSINGKPVSRISQDCFRDHKSLTQVTIPEGVTRIDQYAFSGCPELAQVSFPASATEILSPPFLRCYKLMNIQVSPDNPRYFAQNGALYSRDPQTLLSWPAASGTVTVPEGTTVIGGKAFALCGDLTQVHLPSTLRHIEHYAFNWCVKLKEIRLPEGLESIGNFAFFHCENLQAISLPDSVTALGNDVFNSCSRLQEVRLSEELTVLPPDLFNGCYALHELRLPQGLTEIQRDAFFTSGLTRITIPQGVTEIGNGAFAHCSHLERVEIPDSVEWIADDAFYNATRVSIVINPGSYASSYAQIHSIPTNVNNLTDYTYTLNDQGEAEIIRYRGSARELTIPAQLDGYPVRVIREDAFRECAALVHVTIPQGVRELQPYAFGCCFALESIRLPASVTVIHHGAFFRCQKLRFFQVDGANPAFFAKGPVLYEKNTMTLVSWPSAAGRIAVPDGITAIGKEAFSSCSGLTEVTLPDSLRSIGVYAFNFCQQLTTVHLPEHLTQICDFAFHHCTRLSSLQLPEGLDFIGIHAFDSCTQLTKIRIPRSITELPMGIFSGCNRLAEVTIPPTVTWIHPQAFDHYPCTTMVVSMNSAAENYADKQGFSYRLVDDL